MTPVTTTRQPNMRPVKRRRGRDYALPGQMNLFEFFARMLQEKSELIAKSSVSTTRQRKSMTPRELFEGNQRLVNIMVAKTCSTLDHHSKQDAKQHGLIGLWEASMRFDPGRGYQFSTFACKIIWRHIDKFRRKEFSFRSGTDSLNGILESKNGEERFPAPDHYCPVKLAEQQESIEILQSLAAKNPRTKDSKGIRALAMHLEGCKSKQIMDALGFELEQYSDYTATVSAGRRALKSDPYFLSYVSATTGRKTKSATATLFGDDYSVAYDSTVYYNHPSVSSDDYLGEFAAFISKPDVSEHILNTVRYGQVGQVKNLETLVTTVFALNMGSILIESVQNARAKKFDSESLLTS